MATAEELEALATALLDEIEQLGKEVAALGADIVESRQAIDQARDTVNAEITTLESSCTEMLAEASISLEAMFEMTQALGGAASETCAAGLITMAERMAQSRAEVEQSLEAARQVIEIKLAEVAGEAENLGATIAAVVAAHVELATQSSEVLGALNEAVSSGTEAANQRMEQHASAVETIKESIVEQQTGFLEHVDSIFVPTVERVTLSLATGIRETTTEVIEVGIDACREEALDQLDQGVKAVADVAVQELLELMNQLGDELLDKADGPRGQSDAMREVIDTLRGLLEPLMDRIGNVRGLAASVGVQI